MHTPANTTSRRSQSKPRSFNVKPILAALIAVGLSDQALAISTVWFGGSGDWEIGSNWSLGQPSGGDVAVIDNGTATVNFDTSILGLMLTGGTIAGTGDLTLTGPATWSGGTISGGAATTFNGSLALTGSGRKIIQNGRAVTATGATTWSGNTANNNGQFEININPAMKYRTNQAAYLIRSALKYERMRAGCFWMECR